MSELAQKLFVWNTEELKTLSESSAIVRNEQSGEIMIKKRLDNINVEIMQKLCSIRHRNLAAVIKVTKKTDRFILIPSLFLVDQYKAILTKGKYSAKKKP